MKTEPYYKLWHRILSSAQRDNFPLRVMFELTYNCNFKCGHCYIPPSYREKYKKRELKREEVFSILGQLKDMKCFYLGFTGGEPFLRPDMIDILEYSKRCGFEVIIYTNGSLIDDKTANALARIRPNKVDITIPAVSEEAFRQVSGVSGARERVFNAIKLLRKKGINLGFKTCIVRANESEAGKIRRFARQLGVFHRVDDYPSCRLNGSKEPYSYRPKSAAKNFEFHNKSINDNYGCMKSEAPLTAKDIFRCGAGFTQAAITPAGELKTCLMIDHPKYRILEVSLKEAWQRLSRLIESVKPEQGYECDKCGLKAYCDWCPARAWLEKKTFVHCNSEDRLQAEARYHAIHRD